MMAVMAEKDPPVFRDFLGIGRKEDVLIKLPQQATVVVKSDSTGFDEDGEAEILPKMASGTSGPFETSSAPGIVPPSLTSGLQPASSDPGSGVAENWLRVKDGSGILQHHGVKSAFYKPEAEHKQLKKRDSPVGRESLQERLQMSVEALENARPQKVPRLQIKDEKCRIKGCISNVDELRLSMQPPRMGGKTQPLIPTTASPEFITRIAKKPERPRASVGVSPSVRLSQLGVASERASLGKEQDLPATLSVSAADEGSRTGMKGSPLAGLLNAVQSTQATVGISSGPLPHAANLKHKVISHTASLEPVVATRPQFAAPPSRQLTIFYGGQAHVFDEVSPEKANQIMQLARSNGKCWSTSYSSRQATCVANPSSEESFSALEREKEKNVGSSHGGFFQSVGPISSEIQALLRGHVTSGNGVGRQGLALPKTIISALTSDSKLTQTLPDRTLTNGLKKDESMIRTVLRPPPSSDDLILKENMLQGGQKWM